MPDIAQSVAAPTVNAAAAGGSMTRAQIVAMGQTDRPWLFIPLAHRALAAHPADAGVRFLLASNYGKLGLRTAAMEQVSALPSEVANEGAVLAIRCALERLPEDRVMQEVLEGTLRANLSAIEARGCDIGVGTAELIQEWTNASTDLEWFRALSGDVLARRRDPVERAGPTGAWLRFRTEVPQENAGEAKERESRTAEPAVSAWPRPVTMEGFNPWVLHHLAEKLERLASGYWPRISIVEPDPVRFASALAACDVSNVLAQERVHVFVGERAVERFAADLRARNGTQISGPVVVVRPCGVNGEAVIESVIRREVLEQKSEESRLLASFARGEGVASVEHWRGRYSSALGGSGAQLRLLVATCRFTTFVKHSAHDIAAAMREFGHEAEILIEPDDSSLLSSVGYLRAIAECSPDLVLVINRTRANLKGMVPSGVPVVCWIQDAMAEIYDDQIGAAQGPLDFVVGHTIDDLFSRFGYPRERTLTLPVVASEQKFRRDPVSSGLREELSCDLAYVSHHSERPEDLHDRLLGMAGDVAVAATLEAIRPRVRDAVARASEIPLQATLRLITEEAARHVIGRDADPRLLTRLCNQYTLPMADRLLRHQTLRWAASICDRRGWSMRLHGKGWDGNPEFAQFASRTLEHGEELRASYQAARAHLHVSVHWPFHQRVMECALSGGMPLCLAKWDDAAMLHGYTALRLSAEGLAHACRIGKPRMHLYSVADHADAMRMVGLWQRMGDGRGQRPNVVTTQELIDAARLAWDGMPLERDVAWMLGDPTETMFRSESELETVLERAVERPDWRESASAGIAGRVRRHFTYRVAIERIVDLVASSLGAA